MKKSTIATTMAILITGSIFTGCMTPAQKVNTTQSNVTKANEVLDKANK